MTSLAKILIIDDNPKLLEDALPMYGYEVKSATDGLMGIKILDEDINYDLVLLDVVMPNLDGWETLKAIRKNEKIAHIPIIMLTSVSDANKQISGLKFGADDYVTKPFILPNLLARIEALLRRSTWNKNEKQANALSFVNGEEISLTVREFDILFKMLSYPKKTFTRSALMAEFWDYDSSTTSRTVDVYMAKLREKTSACDGFEIATVHGLGYKVVLK